MGARAASTSASAAPAVSCVVGVCPDAAGCAASSVCAWISAVFVPVASADSCRLCASSACADCALSVCSGGERFLCSVLLVCRVRCLGLLGLLGLAFFCLTFFSLACFLRCRRSGRTALLRGAAAFSRIAAVCLGLLWRFGWLIFLFLVLCRDWGQRIAHLVNSRLIDVKVALINHCEGVSGFVVGDVICEVKFPLPHCQHQVRRVISLIVRSNEVDRPHDHSCDQ